MVRRVYAWIVKMNDRICHHVVRRRLSSGTFKPSCINYPCILEGKVIGYRIDVVVCLCHQVAHMLLFCYCHLVAGKISGAGYYFNRCLHE